MENAYPLIGLVISIIAYIYVLYIGFLSFLDVPGSPRFDDIKDGVDLFGLAFIGLAVGGFNIMVWPLSLMVGGAWLMAKRKAKRSSYEE